jgi:putative endonuclease
VILPSKLSDGRSAEHAALSYLQARGLTAITVNYRCRWGEIDIICTERETLVFVEVRYRNSTAVVRPEETVAFQKQQRIVKTALHYLQHHRDAARQACRFDVVAVSGDLRQPHFEWVRGAFQS